MEYFIEIASIFFQLQIRNHKLTVIATDGYSIEPVVVDSVVSLAGERYDIIMNAVYDTNTSNIINNYFT